MAAQTTVRMSLMTGRRYIYVCVCVCNGIAANVLLMEYRGHDQVECVNRTWLLVTIANRTVTGEKTGHVSASRVKWHSLLKMPPA